MTEQEITTTQALKSKQNYTDFIAQQFNNVIEHLLEGYPSKTNNIIQSDITQNENGLLNAISQLKESNAYIFWFINNPKEELMNIVKNLNKMFSKTYGIFIIQTIINNDKTDFECLVKPSIPIKSKRNENSPAKLIQNEYWNKYFEICDELQSEMQINPAPQHYQYISIGKAGVQIMQTINTKEKYVATELFINSKQEIFDSLFNQKEIIENELGELDWQALEGKKSSRIRKCFKIDFINPENTETAAKEHIKMAEDFKTVFTKLL